jgi:PAS domain S-box-containing protein
MTNDARNIGSLSDFWREWPNEPPFFLSYAIAVLSVAVATALLAWFGGLFVVPIFLCAVVFSAMLGGWGPGLAATASALAATYLLIMPAYPDYFAHDALHLSFLIVPRPIVTFSVAALIVTFLGATQRRAATALRRSNTDLDRKVRDLECANRALEVAVAERKREEAVGAESARLLQGMLDSVRIGFVTVGRDRRYRAANKLFSEMLGYSEEELRNLTPAEITHEEDRARDVEFWKHINALGTLRAGGEDGRLTASAFPQIEKRYRRKDGEVIWVGVIASLLPYGDDDRFALAVVVDITERKRAEEDLQLARAELWRLNRIMLLGEMTASMAHEINQPIAGVITNANAGMRWLTAEPPDLGEVRETLARIVRDGNRAAEVINRVRAGFRRRSSQSESIDINGSVREMIRLIQTELKNSGVQCRVAFCDSLPAVAGDRVQLDQVLLNLITNAIEAMAAVEDGPRELIVGTGRDDADHVFVEVRDTGPGFDRDSFGRLFNSFYTTKLEGMGMGLAICRSIIEAHGGKISAAPNEPHGAVFRFTLPVEQAAFGNDRERFAAT